MKLRAELGILRASAVLRGLALDPTRRVIDNE
jgi:hypothetical protein